MSAAAAAAVMKERVMELWPQVVFRERQRSMMMVPQKSHSCTLSEGEAKAEMKC
jgi:hypothetical protein